MMKVSILGSGVVGQSIGKNISDVIFYDINKDTIDRLKGEGFGATDDLGYALRNSYLSFICIPTPSRDGIDLGVLDSLTKECSKFIEDYHVFVVKSTTVPGTTESLVIPNLESSGKKVDSDFGVVYNPEFLTEISHTWTEDKRFRRDLLTEDKIIFGEGRDKGAGNVLEKFYRNITTVPIIRTNYKTAEMVKYANNMRLASAISYSNEIFQICERLRIDGEEVAKIVAMDKRIGEYGSVCGKAFGGKCLPKDLRAMIEYVEKNTDYNPEFLKAIEDVNEDMKRKYGVRE